MDEKEIIRKKCRYCGQEIFLIPRSGRRHIPVDPALIPFWWSPTGAEQFITRDGEAVTGDRGGDPEDLTDVGYIPHRKTCTREEQFRRR